MDEYEYTPSVDGEDDIDIPLSADYIPDDVDDCVVIHRTPEEEKELMDELDQELDRIQRERNFFIRLAEKEFWYLESASCVRQHIIGRVLVKFCDYGFTLNGRSIPPGSLEDEKEGDDVMAFIARSIGLTYKKEEYFDQFVGTICTK